MLIFIIFLQFREIDYHGFTPGVEALAMGGVPVAASLSNPSSVYYNPAGLSILPGAMLRYERYYFRDCGEDTGRFPNWTIAFISPQLSFTYHPTISFDETTEVVDGSVYKREHRRVNLTEFVLTLTSRTGNELTYREHLYLGLNFKLYSGNFFDLKVKRVGNLWQEPEEIISSTLSPGFDLGAILWYNKLTLGAMVEDVYTRIAWKGGDPFTLKRCYRMALGVRPTSDFILSSGLEYRDRWLIGGGSELFLGSSRGGIFLRGGIDYDPDRSDYHYSGGLGIFSPRFRLDGSIRYLDPGMVIVVALTTTGY
ncbi:hypothetical protein DRP53_06790 [candidate division WOR-3 bacterium]|uniref:PorV/PorQ family protein n=1 Tax=candidate division WOR-3 bacterium TaxID=2052148 RepID=A0A660SGH4_UNCW3|nr:MAG: hypothetical protein DRP53_06790 [candidate division WOR-3 bacterium]